MSKKIIQPLGLHRSGTNYIARLIVDNFDNNDFEIKELYWKHNFQPPLLNHNYLEPANLIFFIYKDLYTWIESIAFRESWGYEHRHQFFHPFEKTSPEFTLGPKKLNLINLAKTYNKYIENWLIDNIWLTVNNDFINKLIVIKYEDLLDESYLIKLFDKLKLYGLNRISDKLIIAKLGEVEHSKFNYPDDHLENLRNKKTYYLTELQKQQAFAQLSDKVIKLIGQ